MFTIREEGMIRNGYFTIIQETEQFIEFYSNNTKHYWIVFKNSIDANKPVTIYHKHTANTKYYHKHWETWNVECAVKGIKNHDAYVLHEGKAMLNWKKEKGSRSYGRI